MLKDYRRTTSKSTVLDRKAELYSKRRYKQNLPKTFYVVTTKSLTPSLDSDDRYLKIACSNDIKSFK